MDSSVIRCNKMVSGRHRAACNNWRRLGTCFTSLVPRPSNRGEERVRVRRPGDEATVSHNDDGQVGSSK